jgi:hypothetical protein
MSTNNQSPFSNLDPIKLAHVQAVLKEEMETGEAYAIVAKALGYTHGEHSFDVALVAFQATLYILGSMTRDIVAQSLKPNASEAVTRAATRIGITYMEIGEQIMIAKSMMMDESKGTGN